MQPTPRFRHFPLAALSRVVVSVLCVVCTSVLKLAAAESLKRPFDVPADWAEKTLRIFSAQSGCEVLFASDAARGVRTNAVKGEYSPRDAVNRMLAGTALQVRDERNGVFRLGLAEPGRKTPPPPEPGHGARPVNGKSRAHSRDPPPASPLSTPQDPLSNSPTPHNDSPPVKTRTFLALFAGWLAAGSPAAVAQDTGTIEGRVFNAATGEALINARVQIDGTTRQATTDESGAYRLAAVPAGEVRLAVTYIGMERETAIINVPRGSVVQREFELRLLGAARPGDVVKLDAVTVVADREMSAQAIAMNERRAAPNIKNVVATDEFGDRGSENIGEFLQFLPGVSITTSGSEPTTVSLRGFPGNNSGLTIDGGEVAGSFTGNSRALDLREVPMSNVSRVEVTKVPTPDMPASSLGGSINLISRSGFETKQPKFTYNLYAILHDRVGFNYDPGPRNHNKATSPDYLQPSFDFSYLRPVSRNLALTFAGGRTWRYKPMETGDKTDETATFDLVRMVQTASQWNSLAQVTKTLQGQVGLEWRVSPQNTLSATAQFRLYHLYTTRSVLQVNYGAGATGGPQFTQGAPTGVGTVSMNNSGNNIRNDMETNHFTLKHRHRGDVWRIDLAAAYSLAMTDRASLPYGHFNTTPASISNLVVRGDEIPASGGIIPTRYSAVNRAGQSVDIYDGGNYAINSGTSSQIDGETGRLNARVDFSRDYAGRVPLVLKFGAAIDTTKRDQRNYDRTWNFRPQGAADEESRRARRFDVFDEGFIADSPSFYGRQVRWISGEKLYDLFRAQPSWFVEDLAASHQSDVNNSREFSESITAGYVRGDLRLLENRLWIVAGLRYERTDLDGRGPLNDVNAQYQRNPDGSFVRNAAGQRVLATTDPLALRKLRFVARGAYAERNYDGWYPSLNATYTLSDNVLLRGAYARSLGRPNINFIIPGTTITEPNVANPTITVSNPSLQPWTADSFDLSLESYLLKGGFGSVGVFRKNISNFFGQVQTAATPELLRLYGLESDPSLLDYTISTRMNAGSARIDGVEFSYRQSLLFLPRWARGFQVFVNATKLNLSGSNAADFTGYNPEMLAGGINFVRERFALRLTVNYLGNTRRAAVAASATVPPETFNYQAKRTRIGLNGEFSLTRRLALYASVVDLGGFETDDQRYAPSTPTWARRYRLQELGFYTNFGVRGTF